MAVNPTPVRALSGRRFGTPRCCGVANRPHLRLGGEFPAASAFRQDQGVCGYGEDPHRTGTRGSDCGRGRPAGILHVCLARSVGAKSHARAHHRQAEFCHCGHFGGPIGATAAGGSRNGDFSARAAKRPWRFRHCKGLKSRSGGRSSRRQTSRRSERLHILCSLKSVVGPSASLFRSRRHVRFAPRLRPKSGHRGRSVQGQKRSLLIEGLEKQIHKR